LISEPASNLTTEETTKRCDRAIALVRGRRGSGTGFLICTGLLATNAHVIALERIEDLHVSFPDLRSSPLTAELLFEDMRRDLALLAVPTGLAPLEIEPLYEFRRGQDVTVIGNPGIGNLIGLLDAPSEIYRGEARRNW
jgi:S1-C subfamily serine protease